MSRLPVRDLSAVEVLDLVTDLEARRARAQALAPLAACYGLEAAVLAGILADLEATIRRPPLAQ